MGRGGREGQLLAGRKGGPFLTLVDELQGIPKNRMSSLKHSLTARERNDKFICFISSHQYNMFLLNECLLNEPTTLRLDFS